MSSQRSQERSSSARSPASGGNNRRRRRAEDEEEGSAPASSSQRGSASRPAQRPRRSESPRRSDPPFQVRYDDDGREISGDEEEDDGEDLLDEGVLEEDYKAIPELDRYSAADLDDEEYDSMDAIDRARAEREMAQRDAQALRRAGRVPAALEQLMESESERSEEAGRRRRRIADGDEGAEIEFAAAEERIQLEEHQGPIREYLIREDVRREIRRRFHTFLFEFKEKKDDGEALYPPIIVAMCRENRSSLEVNYTHISTSEPTIAIWLADHPEEIIQMLDEEAFNCAVQLFPNYSNVSQEIHVRITGLPIIDSIRDLRQIHLTSLVKVEGVVTRRTGVFPQLKIVKFNCSKCYTLLGPYTQQDNNEITPGRCPECQSKGPFNINSSETIYRNYQKITLQESPGSVPAGRVPRQKDVILLHDLIDSVTPGELVEITGIYKHQIDASLNTQNGFPVFATFIQANYVSKQSESITSMRLTDHDEAEILKLSKRPDVAQLIFNSIAPSIYGHQNIKIALALSMLSGEPKEFQSGHRIRGDINVLVLGDPGTAKSQFLKYIEKVAPRAIYTTGKGASAVGLTASVHRDVVTREWSLEGGALVLADRGVCLIDEFDKMNDQDRTSIHEAMEQQSISISKAGIITTLKARCAVIAAANPIQGRYNSSATFAENVELSDAILSRFDVLCVVRDTVDVDTDSSLASFVVESHMKAHPQANAREFENSSNRKATGEQISQELLRKYIIYARQKCHPKLNNMDDDKIARLYADLRRESMITGGLPIAVRHIESMIRLSEAHAKLHLRDFVTEDDVNMAIRVMLESFISTQKFSVMRSLRRHFDKYLTFNRDTHELLLFALQQLLNEQIQFKLLRRQNDADLLEESVEIPLEEFQARADELQLTRLDDFFKSQVFSDNGFKLDRNKKIIVKTFQ